MALVICIVEDTDAILLRISFKLAILLLYCLCVIPSASSRNPENETSERIFNPLRGELFILCRQFFAYRCKGICNLICQFSGFQ
jgi:hypothetical protein